EYTAYLSAQSRGPVTYYEHREIGYYYCLINLLAAIDREHLTIQHGMIESQRAYHQRYNESNVESWAGITLIRADNPHRDNDWLSAILVDEQRAGFSAGDLGAWLAAHSIETRSLWKPMHLQPVFTAAPMHGGQVSESLFASGLTLPSGSALS